MERNVSPLGPYRVLDLTQDECLVAGRLMAELGAEVIQIEPPGGHPSRRRGPFYHDVPDPEKSLVWWGFCAGKKSVVLDLDKPQGRRTLRRLACSADFVLESFAPGYLDSLGIGYTALARENPHLIMASITPFGQTGPKAHYKASELIAWAASGVLYASGDPGRPPVALATPLAGQMGAAAAVLGCLMAHWHRLRSGQGQQVDVSLQEVMDWLALGNVLFWPCHQTVVHRVGWGRPYPSITLERGFQCRDGWSHIGLVTFSRWGLNALVRLLQWIEEAGMLPEWLKSYDWAAFDPNKLSQEGYDRHLQPIKEFVRTRTKAEIWTEKLKRDLLAAPVRDFRDNFEDPHLRTRGFWMTLVHPELREGVTYPGVCLGMSKSPLTLRSRAPLIGEHTREILAQLSVPSRARPTPLLSRGLKETKPLAGVRVVDLGTEGVSPVNCKHLADYGATVVVVESHCSPSVTRQTRPVFNSGINGSMLYGNWNTSKLSVSLNLEKPEGRELCRKLFCWADVVSAGRRLSWLKKWGLDYDCVKEMKPDIIYLLTSNMGAHGPDSGSVGLGHLTGALMGANHLCGWPDRGPSNVSGTIGDTVSFFHGAIAILAALEYRRRTGHGQLIDHSQVETFLWFQSPWILDYSVNHHVWNRSGNRYHYAPSVPYGVFPCKGQDGLDRWVAICVTNDQQWRALCRVMDEPAWAMQERFATTESRKNNQDQLETLVAQWASSHTAEELEMRLQAAGVPAHAVATNRGEFEDPHLQARGFFRWLEHAELGRVPYCGPVFRLSATPDGQRAAPCLGEHNEYVFKDLLGVSEDEYDQALVTGGITTEADFPALQGKLG